MAGTLYQFASFTYDYDSKFGVDAVVRRDASYRFTDDNQWGTFWSLAGRWNIDKMSFMKNSIFNLLKLRVSTGVQGNQNLGVPAFGANPLYTSPNLIRELVATGNGYGNNGSLVLGLSAGGTINSSIVNNTIYGLTSASTSLSVGASSSMVGLSFGLQSSVLENTCSGNTIYSLNNTGAAITSVTGLLVNTPTTGTHNVFKNLVHSLNVSNDSASLSGIYIEGGNGTIFNNMVRLGVDSTGADINTNRMITGIFEAGGTARIYFNTVYIGGSGVTTGAANTFAFYSTVFGKILYLKNKNDVR
jgi:hypothetical protein